MIYTVTFNSSLDYVVRVAEFAPGTLHRTQAEELFAGGKGINVSTVLKRLGADSIALGFVAGFTGREIIHQLNSMDISSDFIQLSKGISRINVKLKADENIETEINGQGPDIDPDAIEAFYEKLKNMSQGDYLILSGSVPKSLPDSVYFDICRRMKKLGVRVIVDAEGELLRKTLKEKPFLIKPNKPELESFFGRELTEEEEMIACAKELKAAGAKNVLVSLGAEGGLLIDEHGQAHRQAAPKGRVINSVGAGDSMVAGFLAELTGKETESKDCFQSEDYQRALRYGVAAGSAAAFSIGLPERSRIDFLLGQMKQA